MEERELAQENLQTEAEQARKSEAEAMAKCLEAILPLQGLRVKLVGAWLWVSGETKRHKEALKAAGCRWSRDKQMWYWRDAGRRCFYRNKKQRPWEEIRQKYGEKEIV